MLDICVEVLDEWTQDRCGSSRGANSRQMKILEKWALVKRSLDSDIGQVEVMVTRLDKGKI